MTADNRGDGALHARVFTSAARGFGRHGQTFSPTTSTLVVGESDAVLIDAQYTPSEVKALGDMIEQAGKRLTTIYVTHAHADHYFGLGQLITRFPTARPVTTGAVLDSIKATLGGQVKQWQEMFAEDVAEPNVLPAPMTGGVILLEGNELRVIEVGQGDIYPSTVVHIPSLDTVVAGDVVYNLIHPMLALSGPDEWQAWTASIDTIAELGPHTIVAGHKRPDAPDDDIATILDGTRGYIRDFHEAVATNPSADAVVQVMKAKYATYGNLTTLIYSASAAFAPSDTRSAGGRA
jgi:glyoxylase-like metal-dependent hydrolase (beta-lactamase superfamily II)